MKTTVASGGDMVRRRAEQVSDPGCAVGHAAMSVPSD
ncbi:hypothetical protein JOF45_001714 [Nesterenkonia lacusekhoensis]|uniref:Uncharacterized protein n=1 Tax=Nesterenkonia lacusekhoensis TaxID=150832 RepID=A0ABS4T3K6_9MICC|nr:hypothetical protein [Nesterenkonia lacusekhoensis]